MIKKTKWETILVNKTNNMFDSVKSLLEDIDEQLSTKLEITTNNLKQLFDEVESDYLSTNGLWKELPLYMSSYKEHDKRVWRIINQKLLEYCAFYKKILVDNGVSRLIKTHSEYNSSRTGSSSNKDLNSQTPQNAYLFDETTQKLSNVKFEQAIADYASDLTKSDSTSTADDEGENDSSTTGASWEESLKNLRLMFFNELVDYIANIPQMIYEYYSLDTYPLPELTKGYILNIIETFKNE